MLPLPHTPTAARRQLTAYLNRLKSELPAQLRTRTVKGTRQHYLVQPKAISDGARTTARLLLVLFLDAILELRRVPLLLEPATDEAPARRTPPPVATNCEALARKRGISARAIRDHLRELLKIGFLTRKVFRGWQDDFELFIAPEFVWAKPAQNAPQRPKKRPDAPAGSPAAATNFPPSRVLERQDKGEIEIGPVEKLVTAREPAGAGALTGNTGPQQPAKPASPRPAPPRQATKAVAGGAAAAEQHAERLGWVTQAWHYLWKRVYPSRRFDEQEQHKALHAMWYGVYRGFDERLSHAGWQRYHDQVLQRIDLAAAYFERHPNKFAPSPYAEFVKGTGYLDAENRYGFVGTEEWLARQEANNRQRNLTRALLKARQQLKAHRLGIAPKRTQALTSIQLYRYHEAKIRAFGPEALQRFYAQVAQPTAPTTDRIAFSPLSSPQ